MLMQSSSCICGKKVPFKREICPYCGKPMTFNEIGNNAEILTYTTLYTVPEGFDAPIYLTLVKLENGAKLLCECKKEVDLEIGKKGKIVFEIDKYYFVGNK
jgi:uncharacterized OB-fold protein